MKILVTGAGGLLGHWVGLAAQGPHEVLAQWRREPPPKSLTRQVRLDLVDAAVLRDALERWAPDAVIHCAAMADPGACERAPDEAQAINLDSTRTIARYCGDSGCRLVFVSTDLVFDGRRGGYAENDAVSPISRYAETKVLAEAEVRGSCLDHAIARSALLYGPSLSGNRSSDEVILGSLRAGRPVQLFVDEYRTPACAPDLAQALVSLAESNFRGTVHCGGSERISRFDLGVKFCRAAGLDPARIIRARVSDFQGVPPRAPDVSLDSGLLRRLLGRGLVGVDEGLKMK